MLTLTRHGENTLSNVEIWLTVTLWTFTVGLILPHSFTIQTFIVKVQGYTTHSQFILL